MLQSLYCRFVFCFVLLFVVSISFPLNIFSFVSNWLNEIKYFCGISFFGSDSKEMYQIIGIISICAITISTIWLFVSKKKNEIIFFYWTHVLVSYLLAFFLLRYGFDKLFKHQFYLPEPNILYTPVGLLSKDILFWTSMGTSQTYNIFMGLIEIIPAFLLFFKRTRMLGGLISFAVLLNVLMINIGFDITVKILSCFLLFLSLIMLLPYSKILCFFFFQTVNNQNSKVRKLSPRVFYPEKSKMVIIIKNVVIYSLIFESLFPFIQINNFNDDHQKRPRFHGVYSIEPKLKQEDNYSIFLGDTQTIKRFFVHRQGYFIVQYNDESMKDFPADLYSLRNHIEVTTPHGIYHLRITSSLLTWKERGRTFYLNLKKLNWKKLPLMKDECHWISEY